MTASRLNVPSQAIVNAAGDVTILMPPVPVGMAWTGSVVVLTSAGNHPWTAEVGGPAGGVQWGAPWYGPVPYGPVQAFGGETVTIRSSGLNPGDTHLARWIGAAQTHEEAEPTWPVALGTPQTIAPGGGGGNTDPIDFSHDGFVTGAFLASNVPPDVGDLGVYTSTILGHLQAIVVGLIEHIGLFIDGADSRIFSSVGSDGSATIIVQQTALPGTPSISLRVDATSTDFHADALDGSHIIIASDLGTGPTLGFFGGGISRAAHIPNPAGGVTIDAEARTAIDAILNLIGGYGLMAP